jgi:SSS family solute:Na+ symporter
MLKRQITKGSAMNYLRSHFAVYLTVALFVLMSPCACLATESDSTGHVSEELRGQAVDALRETLDRESRWVKVHAAEFLLALDHSQGVAEVFAKELDESLDVPEYRIGIWRVLSRAAIQEEQRSEWTTKIRDVFLDEGAPDRAHAAETLGKLDYIVREQGDELFDRVAQSDSDSLSVNVRWVLANSEHEGAEARLAKMLESDQAEIRGGAAYALRFRPEVSPAVREKLAAAAERESTDSTARIYLISAATVHAGDDRQESLKDQLRGYINTGANTGTDDEKFEACMALAQIGTIDDLPSLTHLLQGKSADVRSGAAYAILRIDRRQPRGVSMLDWLVIAVYAMGMLAVGWYYARRTKNTEDYLLGGRTMNPLAVGLSMFASLLSTLSYLSVPGEMIKHGPAILLGALVPLPFVYWIVGWYVVPYIMKLQVTSAYEILESRLGLTVRMIGSIMFLLLRISWMAAILYATTSKVLVPMMGLSQSATLPLCAMLGVITVIYTSMGGLRAVVLTDVIQTAILLGAAILTFVLCITALDAAGSWWPTEWPSHWPEPSWGLDSSLRTSFFAAVISMFTWWICTSGSDQMAIQRYLATRDVKAARTVLATSLILNVVVIGLLSLLGLALLAFFSSHPHLVFDGQAIFADSDQLFPRFIVTQLPVGVSGLAIAGLLAAAMSSLSSGVNSSCSVITVDFVDRFRNRGDKQAETDHVRLAKFVSVVVGVVVVLLSTFVGSVEGNLTDISIKVTNLLVAPLFGLFFMAMFVPWATSRGTIVGGVFGLVTVSTISFWQEFSGTQGIGILWAMPLSLVVQVTVGCLASLSFRQPSNPG